MGVEEEKRVCLTLLLELAPGADADVVGVPTQAAGERWCLGEPEGLVAQAGVTLGVGEDSRIFTGVGAVVAANADITIVG